MRYSNAEIQHQVDKLVDMVIALEMSFPGDKDVGVIRLRFQFCKAGLINGDVEMAKAGLDRTLTSTLEVSDEYSWKRSLVEELTLLKEMIKDRKHIVISQLPVQRRPIGCTAILVASFNMISYLIRLVT